MNEFIPGSAKGEALVLLDPIDQSRVLQGEGGVYTHAHAINAQINKVMCSTHGRANLAETADFFVRQYDHSPVELTTLENVLIGHNAYTDEAARIILKKLPH